MSRPLAVLISVYRAEDPVAFSRAVRSVLDQALPANASIRIYLGVDGPVPPALSVAIQQLEPELYRCAWFTRNRGLVHVLNDLIRSLDGEDLIFRMDTDDISHRDRFVRQIAFMDTHLDIDVLGTSIVEVGSHGTKRVVHFAATHEAARQGIAIRVPIAHPTACIRRRVFDTLGGYPVTALNEDVALWFACLEAGFRFCNIREPLYDFTISPAFWRRRGAAKAWGELRTYLTGLQRLEGTSWRMVFPLGRFLLRLMPGAVQRRAYASAWRSQANAISDSARPQANEMNGQSPQRSKRQT